MTTNFAIQVYDDLLAQVRAESCGRQRRALINAAARKLDVSVQTVYRNLRGRGWKTGRKRRRDAGKSAVGDAELRELAQFVARARNKRGQVNSPVSEAFRAMQETGRLADDVSYSTVCRRLHQVGLDRRRLTAQEPGIWRASDGPNAVWFFDISVAIQWYFRDESGKKLDLYPDAGARFYEGKIENYQAVRKVIRRYMVTDHTSGAYFVRYYYGSGELATDVVDFLWHAMSESTLGREVAPFRGIPRRMVLDQGSANKSALVGNLLQSLGVEVEFHAPGNAKASGSVESRHNHWQRSFEGRLSQSPAKDLTQLNAWAAKFAAVACGERVHSRHGMAPYQMWLTMRAEDLVEAPDRQTFFQFAVGNPREGVLTNRLTLRADGRKWYVHGDHVYAGQRVKYRLSPFIDAGIRVWDMEGRELAADELHFDQYGFPVNGPVHRWGDESAEGFQHKTTAAKRIVQAVDSGEAAEERLTEVFDGLDQQLQRHRYLSREGRDFATTAASEGNELAEEIRLSSIEAREWVARELGRPLGSDGDWWRARIGSGVTESELAALLEEFTTTTTTQTADMGVG